MSTSVVVNATRMADSVNGLRVDLHLNNKEDIAFALRHLADTIEHDSTQLVEGMFAYMADTGRTIGEWRVK
jgi:hypothetical protein